MGSLLEIQNPLGKGPTISPLQSILETSSLAHSKNAGNGGPMVSALLLNFFFVRLNSIKAQGYKTFENIYCKKIR